MSIKSRTIDNLGIETSIRYAKDKEFMDHSLIEESKFIPKQTEVAVTAPYFPSEFEALYSTQVKTAPWADFFEPPVYMSYTKMLFSYQIIPNLGTAEKQQLELEKIKELLLPSVKKRKKRKNIVQGVTLEEREEEKERKALINLLECLGFLDKQLGFINMRRGQYHKG